MRLALFALVVAGLLLGTSRSEGQERPVSAVVLDSVTGRPLEGVSAYFTTSKIETRTDQEGRFRLIALSARDSVLVVRRIGYVPRTVVVTPDAPWLAVMDIGSIYLRPVATQLDRIAVETEEVRRYPQLNGFYQRKAHLGGLGHFMTREFVERSAAMRTSDVLRSSHKVEIECGRRMGAQCIATSRRARETRLRASVRDSANLEEDAVSFDAGRCRMDIWVDGVRSPFDLDTIPVDWIVGIEVYSGPGSTPVEFGMGACGVIAIWTAVPGA
jgi:hypothetical protein